MNKTQTNSNQLKWGLHKPKYSMTKSALLTKNTYDTNESNQDLLKVVIVSQDSKNHGSLKNVLNQENFKTIKQKRNVNDEIITLMQKENINEQENKMINQLKIQQKIQPINKINMKIKVLQTSESTQNSTNDLIKSNPSVSQSNSNHENCDIIDDTIKVEGKIDTNDNNGETISHQNIESVQNESQNKKRLIKTCSQPISLKINDTLNENEKKLNNVIDNQQAQQEKSDGDNKKNDLSGVRYPIKQKNSIQQLHLTHHHQQLQFASRSNAISNKILAIKDLRNEKQNEQPIQQAPSSHQRLSFYNSNQKSVNSQRILISLDQESNDAKKVERSISSKQYNQNERKNSVNIYSPQQNIEQQQMTAQQTNQFHQTQYMSSMQDISPKYNNMIHTRDRFLIQNTQLIKKAQAMSSIYKNEKLTTQLTQLNFPSGPFYSTQTIHSLKPQKNCQGTISIQALVPSQQQKILQSPHTSQSTIQIQNIEEFQNIRKKSNILSKSRNQYTQNNPGDSLNNKTDDDYNQDNSSFQRSMRTSIQLSKENFTHYKLDNSLKQQKLYNYIKNNQGQDILNNDSQQQDQQFKEENFTQTKDRLVQQIAQMKQIKQQYENRFQKSQQELHHLTQKRAYPSISQTYQNNCNALTTSRQSLIQNSYMQKKKIPIFQSQRDLSAFEQSQNNIDLAPFTVQNKENTYLQNLMQRVDDQEVLNTQNSQPKYRYLKSNISLNQSVDNEDEDLYNYTQSVKVQNLNNPIDLELDVETL